MGNSKEEGVRIEELGYTGDLPFLFEDLNCKCFRGVCVCTFITCCCLTTFSSSLNLLSLTLRLSGVMARCRLVQTYEKRDKLEMITKNSFKSLLRLFHALSHGSTKVQNMEVVSSLKIILTATPSVTNGTSAQITFNT